jgi:M6 family metalloprotease-like protein
MKMTVSRLSLTTALIFNLLLFMSSAAHAVPAYPGLVKKIQPNGAEISLYLRGNEKVHWMESEDGYTLLYDENQYVVYATTDEKGNMVPSNIIVQNVSLRSSAQKDRLKNIPKNLRYSTEQINTLNAIWNIKRNLSSSLRSTTAPGLRATIGNAKAICALMSFPDKPLVKTKTEFNNLMNQAGYNSNGATGSVRDFYLENSYGQLEITVTIAGPYIAAHDMSYYGENDTNGLDKQPEKLAIEAADFTFSEPTINPTDYDNDGDGFIDAFHVIYAGYGEEAGGAANTIWAHEFGFPSRPYGNKRLKTYSCSPELRGNSGTNITHIGVICHELCHIFGAPDFYDVNGDASGGDFLGTGRWDLMAGGNWNNGGATPAHINMYQKIKFEWVNPVILSSPQQINNMPNSAQYPVAYTYNTPVSGEYYILENRQKVGFDTAIPGSGLLIYHVSNVTNYDINNNLVNVGHPQKVYPVYAAATTQIPGSTPASYGSINSTGCPFPGSSGKMTFTDYTTPASITWNGQNTGKPITGIQEINHLVSFNFMQPGVQPVSNFQLTRQQNDITLSWVKPNNDVTGYNIYRNNNLLIKIVDANSLSYTNYNVAPGNYNYCITALYNNNESATECQSTTIEGSQSENFPVKNLSAELHNNSVELKWDSPFKTDWVAHTENYSTFGYYDDYPSFSAVVRFTEDDLNAFKNSRLTKVKFYLYKSNCQHKIQIWQVKMLNNQLTLPNGAAPVYEQTVSGLTGVREFALNTPVTLESGKELWIGIKYELNPMTSVAAYNDGATVENRNWVLLGNNWQPDDDSWYISGYIESDGNLLNISNDWLNAGAPQRYSVFRDNTWLDERQINEYTDVVVPSGNHTYSVSAIYNNTPSERVDVQIGVNTGISAINPNSQVKVYPNPVERGKTLTIHAGENFADATISFYTVSGQLLRQRQVSGTVAYEKIDFTPGIYILQVKNNRQIINQKIVVK